MKSPPPQAGLAGGLHPVPVRVCQAPGWGNSGRQCEGKGGMGKRSQHSWCRKEAARGSGRIGLCPQRGISLWEPQFPWVLSPDLVQETL